MMSGVLWMENMNYQWMVRANNAGMPTPLTMVEGGHEFFLDSEWLEWLVDGEHGISVDGK